MACVVDFHLHGAHGVKIAKFQQAGRKRLVTTGVLEQFEHAGAQRRRLSFSRGDILALSASLARKAWRLQCRRWGCLSRCLPANAGLITLAVPSAANAPVEQLPSHRCPCCQ